MCNKENIFYLLSIELWTLNEENKSKKKKILLSCQDAKEALSLKSQKNIQQPD